MVDAPFTPLHFYLKTRHSRPLCTVYDTCAMYYYSRIYKPSYLVCSPKVPCVRRNRVALWRTAQSTRYTKALDSIRYPGLHLSCDAKQVGTDDAFLLPRTFPRLIEQANHEPEPTEAKSRRLRLRNNTVLWQSCGLFVPDCQSDDTMPTPLRLTS